MSTTSLSFKLLGIDAGASSSLNAVGDAAVDAARQLDRIDTDSLNDLADAADDAQRQLSGLDGGATDGINGVGGAADKAGGKLAGLGTAGIAAGAALVGAFGAGLMASMDIEGAIAKMNAQLGATGEDAKRYGEIAGEIYAAGWGESMGDVGAAVAATQKNLGQFAAGAEKGIEGLSSKALALASTFDVDMNTSIAAVGKMLKSGLVDNADEAFDVLTTGLTGTANINGDLVDSFNEYSILFARVGLDAQTMTGLLSQGLQAGARDSDQLADAIGIFGEMATAMGPPVQAALTSIGVDFKEVTRLMQEGGPSAQQALQLVMDGLRGTTNEQTKLTAAQALFGDIANTAGGALYALDPATAAAAAGMGNAAGATDRLMGTLGGTASANLTSFKRNLEMAFVETIGGKVLPAISAAASWLSTNLGPAIEKVSAWVRDHLNPAMANLLPKLTEFGTTIRDDVVPVITQFATDMRDQAMPTFTRLAEIIRENQPTFQDMATKFTDIGRTIRDDVMPAVLNFTAAVGPAFEWLGQHVVPMVAFAFGRAAEIIQSTFQILTGALDIFSSLFTGKWSDLWNGLVNVVQGIWNLAKAIWSPFQWLYDELIGHSIIPDTVNGIVAWFGKLPGMLLSVLAGAISWLYQTGKDIVAGLWNGLTEIWPKVTGWLGNVKGVVTGYFMGAARWLWDSGKSVIQGLLDGIQNVWGVANGWLSQIGGFIGNHFSNAGRWLFDAGKKVVQGLIDGMKSMLGAVGGVASSIAGKVGGFFPGSPVKWGPLHGDGEPWRRGARIAEGLAAGITGGIGTVDAAVARLAAAAGAGMTLGGQFGASLAPAGGAGLASGYAAGGGSIVVINNFRIASSIVTKRELVEEISPMVRDALNTRHYRSNGRGGL